MVSVVFPASDGVVIPLTFDCSLPVFCQNSTLFALTFGVPSVVNEIPPPAPLAVLYIMSEV